MSFSVLYFLSKILFPPDSCVTKRNSALRSLGPLKTRPTLPQFWKYQILSSLDTRASGLSASRAQVWVQLGVAVVHILDYSALGKFICFTPLNLKCWEWEVWGSRNTQRSAFNNGHLILSAFKPPCNGGRRAWGQLPVPNSSEPSSCPGGRSGPCLGTGGSECTIAPSPGEEKVTVHVWWK